MKVRRITTSGWSHYVTGLPVKEDIIKVQPIDVVQDKSDELEAEEWFITYGKDGKVKYVRARSRSALSFKA